MHKLHAKYEKDDFDVQVSINDCTVNEFIFTLYHTGLLKLPVQSKKLLTTDTLSHLVGNDLIDKFGENMPCRLILAPTELPQFGKNFASYDYSEDNYWKLDTQLSIDILCQNSTSESTDFEQATTMILDFSSHFNMNITYSVTMGFELYSLSLDFVEC